MAGRAGGSGRGGRRGGSGRSSGGRGGGHRYPRSARLNETLREIIAEELVRIGDERLEFVTITEIDVDDELNRAHVTFDTLTASDDGDAAVLDVLGEHRIRLQAAVAKQIRAKKTPILQFRADTVIRSAERIDEILREDRERRAARERADADAPVDPGVDDPAPED